MKITPHRLFHALLLFAVLIYLFFTGFGPSQVRMLLASKSVYQGHVVFPETDAFELENIIIDRLNEAHGPMIVSPVYGGKYTLFARFENRFALDGVIKHDEMMLKIDFHAWPIVSDNVLDEKIALMREVMAGFDEYGAVLRLERVDDDCERGRIKSSAKRCETF